MSAQERHIETDDQKIFQNLIDDYVKMQNFDLPENVARKILENHCRKNAEIMEKDGNFRIHFDTYDTKLRKAILEWIEENEEPCDYEGVKTIGELKEMIEENVAEPLEIELFGKRSLFFKPAGNDYHGMAGDKDKQFKWDTACGGTNFVTTKIMWNGSLTSIRDLSYDDLIKIAETEQYDNIALENYGWGCTPYDGEEYDVYDNGDLPFEGYIKDMRSGSIVYFNYELGNLKDAGSIFTKEELQQVIALTDHFEIFCNRNRVEEMIFEQEAEERMKTEEEREL